VTISQSLLFILQEYTNIQSIMKLFEHVPSLPRESWTTIRSLSQEPTLHRKSRCVSEVLGQVTRFVRFQLSDYAIYVHLSTPSSSYEWPDFFISDMGANHDHFLIFFLVSHWMVLNWNKSNMWTMIKITHIQCTEKCEFWLGWLGHRTLSFWGHFIGISAFLIISCHMDCRPSLGAMGT